MVATPGGILAAIAVVSNAMTRYSSLISQGGMKAVVWTDVFQAGVMLAGILAIAIQVGEYGE